MLEKEFVLMMRQPRGPGGEGSCTKPQQELCAKLPPLQPSVRSWAAHAWELTQHGRGGHLGGGSPNAGPRASSWGKEAATCSVCQAAELPAPASWRFLLSKQQPHFEMGKGQFSSSTLTCLLLDPW